MTRVFVFAAALAACAPAVRVAGHCPGELAEGADFSIAAAGLAGSALEFNLANYATSGVLVASAMALALVDNLVECRR